MVLEEVFLKIVNMSVAASWMIGIIMLLRFCMKKTPKWIMPILWGFVAIRLMVPVMFQSNFSLLPSSEPIYRDLGNSAVIHIGSNVKIADSSTGKGIEKATTAAMSATTNAGVSVTTILGIIWLVGIGCMLVIALTSFLRVKRTVSESMPLFDNIRICDQIRTPFILGIIRPIVYLPTGLEKENQEYVLAHEKAHLARFDYLWKPLGYLILSIHWFNPFAWIAYILLSKDIEIACDEKVIKGFKMPEKKAYAMALVDCSMERRRVVACPLAFGEVSVKERVKKVLNYKKPAFWVVGTALVLGVVLMACFLPNPGKALSQDANNVKEIKIIDKKTGEKLTITNHKEIARIAQYVNVMKLERKGLLMRKKVGRFAIKFQPSEDRWDQFILDSDVIVKKPFLYAIREKNGLFDYIMRLYSEQYGKNYKNRNEIGVSMQTVAAMPSGALVQFEQKSKGVSGMITTGQQCILEKQNDNGVWERMKQKKAVDWGEESYSINLDQVTQMTVNWEDAYGFLEPGYYRIVKQINFRNDKGKTKEYTLYSEFEVTKNMVDEDIRNTMDISLPNEYLCMPADSNETNQMTMILPFAYTYEKTKDNSMVPRIDWLLSGTIQRVPAEFTGVTFKNGIPQKSGIPMQNHTDTEYLDIIGLERATNQWPAIMLVSEHELYSLSQLKELEDSGKDISKIEQTSKYWEFWFVKEGEKYYYELTLSAKCFSKEEAIEIAQSIAMK